MALFWKRQEQDGEFYTAKAGETGPDKSGKPPAKKEIEHPTAPAGTDVSLPFMPVSTAGGTISDSSPQFGFPGNTVPAMPSIPPSTPAPQPEPAPSRGLFGRMKSALGDRLQKTRNEFVGRIREVIKAAGKVDDQLIDRIEEILIQADVGAETTMRIVSDMKEFEARGARPEELLSSFKSQLQAIIGTDCHTLSLEERKPCVILVIGVNGVGKTTTIGKLAAEFRAAGKKPLIVAGDTFRAAAIDQLKIWADRTESGFVSKGMGADPAGTAFDGMTTALEQDYDVVLIDTAGRLHTKTNLMEELKKIARVISRQLPGTPHETILVLDATTGQNAIQQAKVFTESIPVTGIVMTKLDGTAKGGVLIGIRNLFKIPVVKIGVGEGIDDLRDFQPTEFVNALFEES